MSTPLLDELTSLNAIYTPTTLQETSTPSIFTLTLPNLPITLRLQIPPTYPSLPLSFLSTETVGPDTPKGYGNYVLAMAREVLEWVWKPEEVCLFDLVEELEKLLSTEDELHPEEQRGGTAEPVEGDGLLEAREREPVTSILTTTTTTIAQSPKVFPWTHSPTPTNIKKSTFIAHACPISDPSEIPAALAVLKAQNPRLERATHNPFAYRIRTTTSRELVYQDSDDDGETAAGGRLLHLLQVTDVWNVLVVVSRWYGGVKLGPDRFRIIGGVARGVLVEGGWVK